MQRPAFFLLAATIMVCRLVVAADSAEIRFSRDVLPILADRCFSCHGPDEEDRQADLRLDQQEAAMAVINKDKPIASKLLARVKSDDPDERMPPAESHRKPLSKTEIETLERWITRGAPWGKHWSFEKPVRPELPLANKHPIDAFVQHRLQQHGLQASPPSEKRTLIRRVTLDLTGLPPTPEEVRAFLADESPQAYEKVVDRLLQSPAYGERMAWPWLDAARYADSGGYQGDPERTMWPWRDWVIEALNNNMPFDQFTIEQLAGDLLPEATAQQRLASGFNRNHMHNSEGGRIAEETRVENIFDRVETTGAVWLGLTFQCARCHDHKFDPTSNRDYFAMFDFFNQTSEAGRTDRSPAVPPKMEYQTERFGKAQVMVMDQLEKPRDTFILIKGQYNDKTETKVTANTPGMLPALPPAGDDGRYTRLDLARWVVSPDNPLTARVTVNRYWQTFFGRGLVSTPDDFGLQGKQPTHPDLLDWLAVEFVESGWDGKHIHKLIVTSKTYKQSARVTPELLAKDAENLWLARAPRFRMPSWMLRDVALAVSGLKTPTIGGPPVKPYQPPGIWAEATFGKKKYQQDTGEKLYRRSVYTFWRRIVGPTMFFDSAKRQTCEVKPNRTNTPLHALATFNDITYIEAARMLAERVMTEFETPAEQIAAIYELVLSRPAEPAELKLLETRFHEYEKQFHANEEAATKLLSIGEAKRDEAIPAATHAASTTIANTILNLDEALVKP